MCSFFLSAPLFFVVLAAFSSPPVTAVKEEVCGKWTAEVHLVYDVSSSFGDDIGTLRSLAKDLFKAFRDIFPNVRIGLGSFSDKKARAPVYEGFDDYCYRTDVPLTTEIEPLLEGLSTINVLWGVDRPESQLDALYHGVMSREVAWSKGSVDKNGNPILKVLIMATDDVYHTAGDMLKGNKFPNFIPHPGAAEPNCDKFDYPSVAQVRDAFRTHNVKPIFLFSGPKPKEEKYYELLAAIGQGGNVQPLSSDSDNVIQAIQQGLMEVACETTTTTTTTTKTTTTTNTTTTTKTTTTTTTRTTTTTTATTTTTTATTTTTTAVTAPTTATIPPTAAIVATEAIISTDETLPPTTSTTTTTTAGPAGPAPPPPVGTSSSPEGSSMNKAIIAAAASTAAIVGIVTIAGVTYASGTASVATPIVDVSTADAPDATLDRHHQIDVTADEFA